MTTSCDNILRQSTVSLAMSYTRTAQIIFISSCPSVNHMTSPMSANWTIWLASMETTKEPGTNDHAGTTAPRMGTTWRLACHHTPRRSMRSKRQSRHQRYQQPWRSSRIMLPRNTASMVNPSREISETTSPGWSHTNHHMHQSPSSPLKK